MDPQDSCFEPIAVYLEGRIAEALKKHFASAHDHLFESDLPPKAGGTSTQTGLPDLPRLSEVAVLLLGKDKLCKALRIRQFARLIPLPAHRYIAYLAHEGLLTEVFTTNFDCCIEQAYRNSAGTPDPANEANRDGLRPIWDTRSYREFGGLSQTDDGTPTLRLYKINGCAAAYASGKQTAEEILWTNRELQSFDSRPWARDCLAVRTRVTTLLVCGFSAEEPQVRYTLLRTLEEQAQVGQVGRPFFVVLGTANFPAQQIIAASLSLHDRNADSPPIGEEIAEWLLSGYDASALGFAGDNFYANDFFERLFQGAIGRLLKQRYAGPDGLFRRWLSGAAPQAGVWCNKLLEDLYPTTDQHDPLAPVFGKHRDVLFCIPKADEPPHQPVPFWRWVWAVVYPDRPCPEERDWYLPLRTDAQLIVSLLLLLSCLRSFAPEYCNEEPRAILGLGLRLSLEVSGSETPGSNGQRDLIVVREGASIRADSVAAQDTGGENRLLLRVTIPEGLQGPAEGRWQIKRRRVDQYNRRWIRTGRFFTLGIDDLIAEAGTPDQLRHTISAAYARFRAQPTYARLRSI